jgi:hypothetical protein
MIIVGTVCLHQVMFCQSENSAKVIRKQSMITALLADPTMKCYAGKLSFIEMARTFPTLKPQSEKYTPVEVESEIFDYAAIFNSPRQTPSSEILKNLKWVISTE